MSLTVSEDEFRRLCKIEYIAELFVAAHERSDEHEIERCIERLRELVRGDG